MGREVWSLEKFWSPSLGRFFDGRKGVGFRKISKNNTKRKKLSKSLIRLLLPSYFLSLSSSFPFLLFSRFLSVILFSYCSKAG
jgi:hypothetical protein